MRKLAFVGLVLALVAFAISGELHASGVSNPGGGAPSGWTRSAAYPNVTLTTQSDAVRVGGNVDANVKFAVLTDAANYNIDFGLGGPDATSGEFAVINTVNGGFLPAFVFDTSAGGVNAAAFYGPLGTYNSKITAGYGVTTILGAGAISAQSAAATITLYANTPSDGDFEVSGQVNVTAATAISTSLNCTYTDVSNTSRTVIVPITSLSGSFLAGGLITSTGSFESCVIHVRAKASTTITLLTAAGTFSSVTYSASGAIRQLK